MMFARRFTATAMVGLLALSAPASAQELSAELKALDAQLPGDLINDPGSLGWDIYGDLAATKVVTDSAIPGGGAALEFKLRKAGANIHDAGASIQLLGSIERGETVTVGFYARTISAGTADGKGTLGVRIQKNVEPYPGFGDQVLSIGTEWDWYEVSAVSNIAIQQRDARVGFQVAGAKQTIQIGQTIVVSGAPSIIGASPPAEPGLPAPLQGLGTLLNDPADRDWIMNGPGGAIAPRDDDTIWLGKATRFNSAAKGENPWDISANVPVGSAIAEGETLVIALAAKTSSASNEDGKARVGFRIQDNQPPYAGFVDDQFAVGPEWQLIRIKTKSTMAIPEARAFLALHFAGSKQAVDIGPVYIFKEE